MIDIEDRKGFMKRSVKIIGIGTAGRNVINRMISAGIKEADFISIDTDAEALMKSHAQRRLQIGSDIAHGLGAKGRPETGKNRPQGTKSKLCQHCEEPML